jgi:hypothetical protein
MKARLLLASKDVLSDGAIVEMVIWEVPRPVPGSSHRYKYRLYYGRNGRRIVAYDNERNKGDHRHIDGVEQPYAFTTLDALLADFRLEVRARRKPR